VAVVACLAFAPAANAQTADAALARTAAGYPNRPILIMAPANPGGGWDQTARVIQHVLTGRQIAPEPVEVFNRGGAGGTIGLADLVGRHRRNPYVVMVSGSVMVGALVTHHSPFALTDTVPLARLVNEYEVVAVPAASPYRTLQQLLDAFRRNPGAMSWGGGSAGGIDHMLAGLLAREVGVPPGALRYVAFTGGGDAAAAVMGGQVTAAISGYGEWKALADSGRVRLLAMSSSARIAPDAPPGLVESGVNVVLSNWRGLVAAPGIAPEARDWLIAALERMRGTEEWQTYLKNNSWEDSFLAGAAFEQFLADDLRTTSETLAGLQLGQGGAGYAAVGPWTFPSVLFAGLTLSLIAAIRVESRRLRAPGTRGLDADQSVSNRRQSVAQTAALLTGYLIAFERAGFVIATFIYLVLQARILGSRHLRRDLIVALVISVLAFGLFDRLLLVSLPGGSWFELSP
jgi:putative tricarboxylic transport membrane protein